MCVIDGRWEFNWPAFSRIPNQFGQASLDELIHTKTPDTLGGHAADDFTARSDELGKPTEPRLKLFRLGSPEDEISPVVEDGDFVVYMRSRVDTSLPAEVLKQRACHAEIAFRQDGVARQAAVWCDSVIKDRPVNEMNPEDPVHIVRPLLPGEDPAHVRVLKSHVRYWRQIFNRPSFPPAGGWFLDPVDFTDASQLVEIARRLASRDADNPCPVNDVTCAQWSYTVLCLSLLVPCTRENLVDIGVPREHAENWTRLLGLGEARLNGLERLPFVGIGPAEILQQCLDTYVPGRDLLDVLVGPKRQWLTEAMTSLLDQSPVLRHCIEKHPGLTVAEVVDTYFAAVVSARSVSVPMLLDGSVFAVFPPSMPFHGSRCKVAEPLFGYVGTGFHADLLVAR